MESVCLKGTSAAAVVVICNFVTLLMSLCHKPSDIFSFQLMSKETVAPFGAELSGDLEQQVSAVVKWRCILYNQLVWHEQNNLHNIFEFKF